MPYCDLTALLTLLPLDRLVELTNDAGAEAVAQALVDEAIAAGVDEAIAPLVAANVAAAIGAADGEINGYLAGRYTVPLNPVPALVTNLCRDLTLYNLYTRRMDEVPKVRAERYAQAVKTMRDLANGAMRLGVADPPPETQAQTMTVTSGDRLFTDQELARY